MTRSSRPVILAVVAVAALALLTILATQVAGESAIARFDLAFARRLDEAATPGWRDAFKTVTLLGTGWALGIASAIVGLGLLLRRHFVLAGGWIFAQGSAVLVVKLVKALVQRERPGLGETGFYAHGWSFPSGHVVRTAVFCGMATYLVFRLTRSRRATVIAGVVGVAWSLIMATARVYLRAHFASDALAGLILATAWVAICIPALEAVDSATAASRR